MKASDEAPTALRIPDLGRSRAEQSPSEARGEQFPSRPLAAEPRAGLYLFHLEPRYRHAQHYLGFAEDIGRRVLEHRDVPSKASPLLRAALDAGCALSVVRVWLGEGRKTERRLKRQGSLSRHCPTCVRRGEAH